MDLTYLFVILLYNLGLISPSAYYQVTATLFNKIFTRAASTLPY
jgi:hypothetical protein